LELVELSSARPYNHWTQVSSPAYTGMSLIEENSEKRARDEVATTLADAGMTSVYPAADVKSLFLIVHETLGRMA
jgi:hypothetical protein